MDTKVTTPTLAPYHQEQLEAKAIPMDVAIAAGARSVLSASDLPEELAYLCNQVPGILYCHTRVNGETVHQYRPDNPSDPKKKYIQAAGTGAVITVHPRMKERLVTATRLMVAEGTKQYLAAVSLAMAHPDLVVVGVQGCRNWSKDSRMVPDFDEIATGKSEVIIAFDGDFKTNPAVWDGVQLLSLNLEGITGVEAVVLDLPVSGTDGLDDFFGARSESTRQTIFDNNLGKAKTLMKTKRGRPKRVRGSKIAPLVDVVEGCIRGMGFENEPGPIIAEFAPRIVSSSNYVDDLSANPEPGVLHTLEIQVGDMTSAEVHTVKDIPDTDLRSIRWWLERIPNGEGTRLAYDNSEAGVRAIEQAIRAFEPEKAASIPRYIRTGWAPALPGGRYGYLHAGGIIGPDGEEHSASADLDTPYNRIKFPDPARFEEGELVAAVKRYLNIFTLLNDPSPLFLMLGAMNYSAAGSPVKSVPFVVGGRGSGKTFVAQTSASCLSPEFAPDGVQMVSADSTENALGDAGIGLHHSAIIVDDLRTPRTQKALESMLGGMERLTRRGYGGGTAGKDRLTISKGPRKISRAETDASSPAVILVGEHLPNAADAASTVERMISVNVSKESTMKDEAATQELREAASSGSLQKAYVGYIQHIAKKIGAEGSIEAWGAQVHKARKAVEKNLKDGFPELDTPRSREVPAPIIVGMTMFLEFAVSIGAASELEAKRISKDVWKRIAAAATHHTSVELGDDGDPVLMTLSRIRSALASQKVQLEEDLDTDYPSRVPVIGKRYSTRDGEEFIALIPPAVAAALGDHSRTAGSAIKNNLSRIAVPDGNGKVLRSVRFSGTPASCLLIPLREWEPDQAEEVTILKVA